MLKMDVRLLLYRVPSTVLIKDPCLQGTAVPCEGKSSPDSTFRLELRSILAKGLLEV